MVCVEGGRGGDTASRGLVLLPRACKHMTGGGGCLCTQPRCAEQDRLFWRAELVVGPVLPSTLFNHQAQPSMRDKPATVHAQ